MSAVRRLGSLVAVAALAGAGCSALSQSVESRPAASGAEVGGVLRVGIVEPQSLDPAHAVGSGPQLVLSVLCDPLLAVDSRTNEVTGALGRSYLSVSGATALTVTIHDGLKFHDGSELSAEDVRYSLSRLARQDVASPFARVVGNVAGFGVTSQNLDADSESAEEEARVLSGITVQAGKVVTTGFAAANGEWLYTVAHPVTAPVPEELPDRDAESFEAQPICAGPYQLAEPWQPGDEVIRLVRFDGYHGKHQALTNGGQGYADGVEFHLYDDAEAAFRGYLAGEVDLVEVPPAHLAEAREAHGGDLLEVPTPQVEYIGFPSQLPPYGNPDFRALLSRAIDRQAAVDKVFDGGRKPATGFVPPAAVDSFRERACRSAVPTRAEETPQHLTEGAAGVLGALKIYVNDEFRNVELVEEVVRQWEERLGLRFEIVALPWNEYEQLAMSGFDGAFRVSADPPVPTPSSYLLDFFHSSAAASTNWARYSDVTYDKLVEVPPAQTDPDQRATSSRLAEQRLCETMPMIPITFGQAEYLVRDSALGRATDDVTDPVTGLPVLRELYVRGAGQSSPA